MQTMPYPQHFRQTRRYTKQFIDNLDAFNRSGKLNPKMCFERASDLVMLQYQNTGIKGFDLDTNAVTTECQAALMYGSWVMNGSAVFAFEPELVESLEHSSVGEVCLNDVDIPFSCAYFDFGKIEHLRLQSGAPVTGAYLNHIEGQALRISLTAPLPDNANWMERYQEIYDLRILDKNFTMNMEDAIQGAIADDLEDIENAAKKIAAMDADERAQLGQVALQKVTERLRANQVVFAKCMNLIVNALCYISAYPGDKKIKWQTNTPEKLLSKASSGTPKEVARAKSKLNAMGYQQVWRVGSEFSHAARNVESGGKSPHWRRGYWKRQHYGPGGSLRKLKLFKATRVLGGSISEDARVYATEILGAVNE